MITLVNTNRMRPPIAPLGLDYLAGTGRRAGIEVRLLDLCLADDPQAALDTHFARHRPELVGLSQRNIDDCFWPSGTSFLPQLRETIAWVRRRTDAPVVIGGVGLSIFGGAVLQQCEADFAIRGDGEQALCELLRQLRGPRRWQQVAGLIYRQGQRVLANPPAWPAVVDTPPERDLVDNATYFRLGGQIGLETKRGCPRNCAYCADPLAKGHASRLRPPAAVADEFETLARRGIDVLHLCDAEFNLPPDHAREVCAELIRRGLGRRLRWYAYLAVVPFDEPLARAMRQAGCVGINFTSDAADPGMLAVYRQPHRAEHVAEAVRLCRRHGIAVMLDMLLGGPGETPQTLRTTVERFKQIEPDCAGAGLGVRIYPHTPIESVIAEQGPAETNPSIRRRYSGPLDLLQPTFYVSHRLGERPDLLLRELIGDDPRFFPLAEWEPSCHSGPQSDADRQFEPLAGSAAGSETASRLDNAEESSSTAAGPADHNNADRINDYRNNDHNYNDNRELVDAIAAGARGAYWDILRKLRR